MFNTAVIDFPTPFRTRSKPDGDSLPYPIMTEAAMSDAATALLKVMGKRPAVCVWTTLPNIFLTGRVMEAAGMRFSTVIFVWVKTNRNSKKRWDEAVAKVQSPDMFAHVLGANFTLPFISDMSWWFLGQGYYSRANAEIMLLYTLRKPPPRKSLDVPQLIIAPVGKHSAKPAESYDRVERLFHGPYIELFARKHRPGWTCIGNDLSGNDILIDLESLHGEKTPTHQI